MRRPNLSGAYGVPSPPPSAATLAHPERVMRFFNFQRIAWAIRIGVVVSLLLLLYLSHVIP